MTEIDARSWPNTISSGESGSTSLAHRGRHQRKSRRKRADRTAPRGTGLLFRVLGVGLALNGTAHGGLRARRNAARGRSRAQAWVSLMVVERRQRRRLA